MTGRVLVGGVAYRNSWVPDGKTVRLVICGACQDTGRMGDRICTCHTGAQLQGGVPC